MRAWVPLCALALLGAGPTASTGKVRGTLVVLRNGAIEKSASDVWVYLEPLPRPHLHKKATTTRHEAIHQHSRRFIPQALVVPSGTVVSFPNDDTELHNVFYPNDPPGMHDFGKYGQDPKGPSRSFDLPEEFEIYCDIHKEMWARIKVVDTTLIAPVVADAFALDVPPGKYLLHAWSPDCSEAVTETQVGDGQTTVLSSDLLHLQCAPPSSHAHRRKNGESYPPY